MPGSLVVDLRDGHREAAKTLPEKLRADLARARVSSNTRKDERARRLQALVLLYRAGPRQIWAPVLLDLLAPALLARLQRLKLEPPFMEEEDIRQQLVVELLHAAAFMPLPVNPSYLRRRLLDRANQGVWRRLAREHRRQRKQRSYEAMVEEQQ